MIELIKDIQEWHEKTFPEFTQKMNMAMFILLSLTK